MSEFVADLKKIKERARTHMEKGAVTENYKADVKAVVKVLNEVLATELVCVLRYKRHYYMAAGINSDGAKAEFLQHATEEQQHADWIATRITQLNGEPNFNPRAWRPAAIPNMPKAPTSARCSRKICTPNGSRSNPIRKSCAG